MTRTKNRVTEKYVKLKSMSRVTFYIFTRKDVGGADLKLSLSCVKSMANYSGQLVFSMTM